ncbi:uncharacterized protein BP01DRAFT_75769 [Aspergillus saccharolyticus JOP 1030-1]|uniref:Secreted protein n=1 Tax=Aspergillus saccharolyticus JOP 1030-1 TaxID=1450539 RepID=A0A318ZNZ1_9EURO|nr:hypothetical protein BP01DRAFT_75769 [Aspergillus saccharolyticus JOP 1030-1]PYH49341.1 hypothetical protein BP01DRAFT_75769 [Aspergillus saccharolyticus JOP 1030-1]
MVQSLLGIVALLYVYSVPQSDWGWRDMGDRVQMSLSGFHTSYLHTIIHSTIGPGTTASTLRQRLHRHSVKAHGKTLGVARRAQNCAHF